MSLFTRTALVGLWLLCAAASVPAQPSFALPELNQVQPGSTVLMPVTVNNFTALTSLQFGIQWDPAVLSFDTLLLSNLPALDTFDFGLSQVTTGIFRFGWTSNMVVTGNSVPNGFTLFTLKFQVVGAVNTSTTVEFTEFPPVTYFEAVNAQGEVFGINQVGVTQGSICVNCNVSTSDLQENFDFTIMPNPVAGSAQAQFMLAEAASVRLTVSDALGRALDERQLELPGGPQIVELPLTQVRTNGLYYLTLRSAGKILATRAFLID